MNVLHDAKCERIPTVLYAVNTPEGLMGMRLMSRERQAMIDLAINEPVLVQVVRPGAKQCTCAARTEPLELVRANRPGDDEEV